MPKTLGDLSRFVEARARVEGPAGEAELAALRAQARMARVFSERRVMLGMTQQRLAELSGVPQSEISKIENARANPTVATLAALARPLELELSASARETTAPASSVRTVWSGSQAIEAPATAPAFHRPSHLRLVTVSAVAA